MSPGFRDKLDEVPTDQLRLTLEVEDPFRLDLTVWALRRREHNLIDRWDGQCYRRTLVVDDEPIEVAARQRPTAGHPSDQPSRLDLDLRAGHTGLDDGSVAECHHIIERTLGLEVDLDGFYRLAHDDPHLCTLSRRVFGMRPPCFPSVFEAVVNAIACQQISLVVGIHLLNRLTQRFGVALSTDADAQPAFPTPERMAEADPTELRELGFSGAKARAVIELAQQVAVGIIDLEALRGEDDQTASKVLLGLTGVGRWSTEYTLLRGLRRWHVFPGDDVGAGNNLKRLFELADSPGYDSIATLTRGWAPYSGLVYFHLLLDGLAGSGPLPGDHPEALHS